MQNDLLVFGPDEVIDDMGRRGISARVTKPFGAYKTLDDGRWRVDSAVTACCSEPQQLASAISYIPASVWGKINGALVFQIVKNCIEIIVDTRARSLAVYGGSLRPVINNRHVAEIDRGESIGGCGIDRGIVVDYTDPPAIRRGRVVLEIIKRVHRRCRTLSTVSAAFVKSHRTG